LLKRTRKLRAGRFNREKNEWEEANTVNTNIDKKTLKIVSQNVLFGPSDKEEKKSDPTYTHLRMPRMFELLESTQADFIALQEVEPPLYSLLIEQKWFLFSHVLSNFF